MESRTTDNEGKTSLSLGLVAVTVDLCIAAMSIQRRRPLESNGII